MKYTTEQVQEMRDWLAQCNWADASAEDIQDRELFPDAAIAGVVARHYDGGIEQFLKDNE